MNPFGVEPNLDRSDTRALIVSAARELFHREGFHSVSLARICAEAGVNPGSLYYYFRTKDALLEAVLEHNGDILPEWIMKPAFSSTGDPVERIFAVLNRYRDLLERTDFALGCPIGNLALELSDPSQGVSAGLSQNFDRWCAWIERCLDQARSRLRPDVDPAELARYVLVMMEGAVLHARGTRSLKGFDNAVRQLRNYFKYLEANG